MKWTYGDKVVGIESQFNDRSGIVGSICGKVPTSYTFIIQWEDGHYTRIPGLLIKPTEETKRRWEIREKMHKRQVESWK